MSAEQYKPLRALNTRGTVTLAERRADGAKCVLKELPAQSEAIYRSLSQLPPREGLMRVREVFAQGERCVAVCDYIEGRTLDELLSGGRTFPTAELRSIVTQLCSAIGHLHRYGIIHRDVAPKNIILDDTLRLTLIDYDISRRYSGKRGQDTALYGTEGFAPPEQYGFRETAFTADIYALGMVMKLLLNACPDCPAAQEVLLRRAAAKCTRFVPDRRYRSAGAVRRAVSRSRFVVPAGAAGTLALAGAAAALLLLNFGENVPPKIPQASVGGSAETAAVTTVQTVSATAVGASITPEKSVPETQTSAAQTAAATLAQTSEPAAAPAKTAAAPPKTTAATVRTTAATTQTTAATAPAEIPQELLPHELHKSDEDNPDKMTVTTQLNERGFYEDYFDYVFYDDPAVHGEWSFCTYLPVEALDSALTADYIKSCNYVGETSLYSLTLGDNGEAAAVSSDGEAMPWLTCWTNGYLIYESGDGAFAQRLFEAAADGEEFLFCAHKSGDFMRENRVYVYAVFTRAE